MRGFLRVYADELGLDGQLYVDEFNSRFSVSGGGAARHTRAGRSACPYRRGTLAASPPARFSSSLAVISGSRSCSSPPSPAKSPNPKVPNLNGQTTSQQTTTTQVHGSARGHLRQYQRPAERTGSRSSKGRFKRATSKTVSGSSIWVDTTAIQNLSWTLPSGVTANGGTRVGPATVLFTPNGHKFLNG